MKLYTKKLFLFLSQFILIAFFYSNTFSQGCDEPVATGSADGTFESLASIASSYGLNNNVTGGGWANGEGTADSWNSPLPNITEENYAAGMMPSPDGGVFAGLWSKKIGSNENYESFNTVVNLLEVGRKYIVKFYQANAGLAVTPLNSNQQIQVTFGSETLTSPSIPFLGISNQVWSEVTLEFTPSSTSQILTFASVVPSSDSQTYMAIDGLRLYKTDGNCCPVGVNDGNSVDEGASVIGNVLNNDTDADSDVLSVLSYTLTDYGTLSMDKPSGTYEYQHNGSENYSDTFTYVAFDGTCVSDTVTVTFSINPINDPPVVVKDTFYVYEGDTLIILNSDSSLIVNNDFDPDNDSTDFEARIFVGPNHHVGLFSLGLRGAFTYIHDCSDEDNVDFFQYKTYDGALNSSISDTVVIYILNEPPIGEPDYYSVKNGELLSIDSASGPLLNDLDSNTCDVIQTVLVQPPTMHIGTFSLDSTGAFEYVHDGSINLFLDYFVYQLIDGEDNAIETDTVFISIVNPPPITESYYYAVDEGKELVVDSIQGVLSKSASSVGLPIKAYLDTSPLQGSMIPSGDINTNGSFVYLHNCTDTPNMDYFLFKIVDSAGQSIDTVFITINNECPNGVNDAYTVTEGEKINISKDLGVIINDIDPNTCDVLSVTLVTPPLYHVGGFTLETDGSFIYTHDDSENFQDEFSYRLSDGECTGSVYIVIINIDSVADKRPIANNDLVPICVSEGDSIVISTYALGVLGNDIDTDLKDSILTATLITNPLHGSLIFNSDGTFTYIHDGGESTVDAFTYVCSDGDFISLDTAIVSICITPGNDCPVALDDFFFINEGDVIDSTLIYNDSDGDTFEPDALITTVNPLPAVGVLELKSNGSFVYTSPAQIATPGPEVVSFIYTLSDGICDTTATVTITINSINDCPIARSDTMTITALVNDTIVNNVIANDTDIDSFFDSTSIEVVTPPNWGKYIINDNGTISYIFTGSPTKRDSLIYRVADTEGCYSNEATLYINVENIKYPKYQLPDYFTPNSDRFNDYFVIKTENITLENVKFEVLILDRYQRKIFESVVTGDKIWDGMNQFTGASVKKDFYYYQITPVEYGDIRARTIVGVIFLDK